jgi:hypothetical protein
MQHTDFRLISYSLASVWIITGMLSLGIYPKADSFALLKPIGITGYFAEFSLYFGAMADIALGVLTIFKPSKLLWIIKAPFVLTYTLAISIWLPEFWLHPFGSLFAIKEHTLCKLSLVTLPTRRSNTMTTYLLLKWAHILSSV